MEHMEWPARQASELTVDIGGTFDGKSPSTGVPECNCEETLAQELKLTEGEPILEYAVKEPFCLKTSYLPKRVRSGQLWNSI